MISQSDQTVAALQDLIERGSLEPGSMVSEHSLMQLTGFGRTPVREAIQRLALSHMLRIHPNRGIEIPAASVEDQLSRLEVRRTIEVLAVTLACERAAREDLADMEVLTAALSGEFSLQSYLDTVRRTHDLIIRAARNPYLETLMAPLQTLSRRFWIMHVKDEAKEIAVGKRLHQRILAAIADRDVEASRQASLELNDYLVQFALDVVSQRARLRA
ncbi:GntR family transcriptional regulator [Paracoccus yeei]|uniref:GntR family transcriptional regulator n=1 Tax=Paracoccus yeei TaxID=147645 RepID=UPI003BF7C539